MADVDDESVAGGPALTVYHAVPQVGAAGRLFVHTTGDPYALVPPVTRIIRELAPDQPVERAATLADVRAAVLAPERLFAYLAASYVADMRLPGALPILFAAAVLATAGGVASLMPAARASRVNVLEALRSE